MSGHGQAEKSQEGKVVVLGVDDERKRKRAEDSIEDLPNSKSFASLPSSSRDNHEDRNPISIASGCSISEQRSEKPEFKSSAESTYVDDETNGSVGSILQVDGSKEAEKLEIEKIMSGPYDTHQAFPEEPDELEDDLEYKNQVKDLGGSMKSSNMDPPNSEAAVAGEPISTKKENTCSTHLCTNGDLEELEPAELTTPFLNVTPAAVPQRKPLIRLNFTSLGKAADKSS